MNLRDRYRPIALASILLVLSCFSVLLVLLAVNQGLSLVNVAIGSAIILIANMMFVASGILIPALVAPGRLVFPLNLTLPLVFSAWAIVVANLSWRLGSPIEPTLEVFRRFATLFELSELAWFPSVQFAVMTLAAFANARSMSQSVDST